MKFFDSNGIVINKKDFGEADRYITIFTETFGKVNVLVKGIRKSKKREQSSTDILTLTKFTFYKKGENFILSNLSTIDSFSEIKENIDVLGIGLYITSILNSILVDNNRKKELFSLTLKSLNFLKSSNDERKNYILTAFYLFKVIKDEGLGFSTGEGCCFSFERSTFSLEGTEGFFKVSLKEKEIVEKFLNEKVKSIIEEEYSIKEIKNVIFLFERYLNFHLGIELKLKNYLMGVEND